MESGIQFPRPGHDYFTDFLAKLDCVTVPKGQTLQRAFPLLPDVSWYHCRRELFSSRVFCLAWPLLAVPLFGLLRIRVTDEASKGAVHAFACRDEPVPLAVDCSPNAERRGFLVLCLRPGQTPLSLC